MKKLVFTMMVLFLGTAGIMAQSAEKAKCSKDAAKSCCASKAKAATGTASATTTMNAKVLSMAMSIADKDENISSRECADTGAVGFYKKNVCSTSGKISYDEVDFDQETKTFVNKSPNDVMSADAGQIIKVVNTEKVEMKGDAKKCAKGAKAACCSSKKKKDAGK